MKKITSLPELACRLTGRRYFQTAQFNNAVEIYLPKPKNELTELRKSLLLNIQETDVHVVALCNLLIAHSLIAKSVGLDVTNVLMATMPNNSYLGDRFVLKEQGQNDPSVIYKPTVFPFPCVFKKIAESGGIMQFISEDVPGTFFKAEAYGSAGHYRVIWPDFLGVVGDLEPGLAQTPNDYILISPSHYPFSKCLNYVKTHNATSLFLTQAGAEKHFGLLTHDSEKLAVLIASLILSTY
jgi:hypothetical protein